MNEIAIVKKEVVEKEWTEKIRQCRENDINLKTYTIFSEKIVTVPDKCNRAES